ncbi:hypothetical protein BHE74_00054584 [Ensete ventricosum]|nr:hypothetical protein BHE74_00054584 [Ensete ventricosum]
MKFGSGAGSGSTTPSAASVPATGDAEVSTVENHPSSEAGEGLRKRLWKFGWGSKRPSSLGGRCPLADGGGNVPRGQTKGRGSEGGGRLQGIPRFESGLKKMGRISYEFEYQVALERLRADITIE